MSAERIQRETASCVKNSGYVTFAVSRAAATAYSPFVPVQSVDNSSGTARGTKLSGVTISQRITLTYEST